MSKELEESLDLVKRTCELYIKSASHLLGSDIIANKINETLDTIKQALLNAQKNEKVLEIITEKHFNFDRFNYVIKYWKTTKEQVDAYNSGIGNYYKLTEEEFDLLKRFVLTSKTSLCSFN